MSDPLTDVANYTGSSSESPPSCFNAVDSDGFFWFGDAPAGTDASINYNGPDIATDDGTWFMEWKMIGGDDGTHVLFTLSSDGFGNVNQSADGPSGIGQFDFGLEEPDDGFIHQFNIFPNLVPSGVQIGIKFRETHDDATPPPPPPSGPEIIPAAFVTFPECPGYGFNSQPQYLVKINTRAGGFERIDARWTRPLSVYTAVPIGDRDEEQIQSILYFWHAMGGRGTAFLIKDWLDYKSCPVQNDVTALDQPLEVVTLLDATTAYQLTKIYSVGALTQIREITQPVGSTIVIANASGVEQEDYILDESSGILKPGPSFTGTPNSWGGEFNVAVRFDSELSIQVADKLIQSVTFTLREKRIALANVFSSSP